MCMYDQSGVTLLRSFMICRMVIVTNCPYLVVVIHFLCKVSGLTINLYRSILAKINVEIKKLVRMKNGVECEIGSWPLTFFLIFLLARILVIMVFGSPWYKKFLKDLMDGWWVVCLGGAGGLWSNLSLLVFPYTFCLL